MWRTIEDSWCWSLQEFHSPCGRKFFPYYPIRFSITMTEKSRLNCFLYFSYYLWSLKWRCSAGAYIIWHIHDESNSHPFYFRLSHFTWSLLMNFCPITTAARLVWVASFDIAKSYRSSRKMEKQCFNSVKRLISRSCHFPYPFLFM